MSTKNWWVKDYRRKSGLSQDRLAHRLGWTNDKVGRIERGTQDISIEEIKNIATALNLSKEEVGSILLQAGGVLSFDIMKFLPDIREEKRFELETHVAGLCMRQTTQGVKILIARRLTSRELFAGKWEAGGGQVKPGENFDEALLHQMKEEFGVEVRILGVIGTYEIPAPKLPQKKIPGVKFLCVLANDKDADRISVSPKEFSQYKWINESEIQQFDFIRGIKKDIIKALQLFKSRAFG